MTNHGHGDGAGSSLFQARKAHLHQHQQQRNTHRVNRRHNNSNDDSRPRDSPRAGDSESLASPDKLQRKPRQANALADVTIVQTVSVVEYLDDVGATVSVETIAAPPVTLGPTQPSPAPLPVPLPEVTLDSSIVPTPTPQGDAGESQSSSTSSSESAVPAESPGLQPPVTSAPLPTASPPGFTAPSGFNSTSAGVAPLFNNSTLSSSTASFSNSSSTASFRALSRISESESLTSTLTSTSNSDDLTTTATPTPDLTNPGFNPAGIPGTPPPASSTTAAAAGTLPPPTPVSTVVGSVIGSVAGAALLILAALLLLRYRRRRGPLEPPSESRALPSTGPSDPPGSSGSGGMAERSSTRALPFAIPATLAALTRGPKRLSTIPSEPSTAHTPASPERGFYRVSGKKLPSVMQHGGDGYSDPRQSTLSGASSFYLYQDPKTAGPSGQQGAARFAVGSPMRPDSGIPVFQPGPARTPVRTPIREEGRGGNPFDDVHEVREGLTPPRRDGVGRSLVGEDGSRGSRGSGSRFVERM